MTAPIVYVVDASVAAQVVAPEPLTAQATASFALLVGGQAVFHVPDLFYIECANIFWKKKQRGVCSESQAVQALSDLLALPLLSTAHALLAVDALKLALALDVTAYDACYLALAERLAVPFITADQKTERLRALVRQVGEDFFRWEAAPVCGVLEEFTWNGKAEASQIDQAARDAYLVQFLELLKSYCG